MGMQLRRKLGFTIVELAVVISVIGILASITVVGYGAWQKRTTENVIKSDLSNAASAMENARNFGNAYPTTVPTSFKPSDNVLLAGGSSDGKTYCIQASSSRDSTISLYVSNTNTTPQVGNCSASTGLVGWWPMNGNANDASGNGRHGTIFGATLTAGKNGQNNGAYSFTNAYIEIPTISMTAVTASAWVYSTNYSQTGFVVGKNPVNAQWEIFFEGSIMRWRGGSPIVDSTNCAIPSNNAWHHLVGTQVGTTAALYIDGAQCSTGTTTAIGNGAGTIDIGRFNGGYYYLGTIDDVRVYNRALSASEVQALYVAGAQ